MIHSFPTFTVQRREPELIAPAKPTPREVKELSDIDDQQGLRFQIPFILFYGKNKSMGGKDPVEVIRSALAQTLVFYHPFAGRLRERAGRKLVVDCTGEGVLFTEADADVSLEQFGHILHPPFPSLEDLLYDVPGSNGITDCPILLIQVTRLKCGGFILAIRLNHSMSDGLGLAKFMKALAEMAHGAKEPSITPVWCRELLLSRNPPRISRTHPEYEEVKGSRLPLLKDSVRRSFCFSPIEVTAIRRWVPKHLSKCTTFEVIAACMWRCRIRALQLDPNDDVRFLYPVNIRDKVNPSLPVGYYGNEFVFAVAVTTAKMLCGNPFGYALELVANAKANIDDEHVRSTTDLMVIKGRPHVANTKTYTVSNTTRSGLSKVDFGWGKPTYSGPAEGWTAIFPETTSLYMSYINNRGLHDMVISISLPAKAMERFAKELDGMLGVGTQTMSLL